MSEIHKSHRANPGRLEQMRSAPINTIGRDLLITGEQLLEDALTFPEIDCIHGLFPGIQPGQVELLNKVSNYTTAATGLLYVADTSIDSNARQRQASAAASLYLTEAQRQLGHLFPLESAFWARFYVRYSTCFQYDLLNDQPYLETDTSAGVHHFKQRYGLYVLPLDALHYASDLTRQLTYELFQQALLAALTGALAPAFSAETRRRDYFNHALRLISKLNINCFDAWITTCMQDSETSKTSKA